MATDKYKGETLGKKIARAWFWIVAREFLGPRFYTGNHLVLASREGGDVAVLKAMGVSPKRIFAMEMSREAATEFASKHPDVNLCIGDVAQTVNHKKIRGTLVCAHLDFCCWFTEQTAETVIRVARFGVAHGGILSVGVMKGREFGLIGNQLKWWREQGEGLFSDDGLIAEGLVRAGDREERAWASRTNSSRLRAEFMHWVIARSLEADGPVASARNICSIGYDSGRTPMLYGIHMIHRHFSRRPMFLEMSKVMKECADRMLGLAHEMAVEGNATGVHSPMEKYRDSDAFLRSHPFLEIAGHRQQLNSAEFGEADPAMAVAMARVVESFGLPAAAVLHVRSGRLAAWRAHQTMGTYKKAG